MTGQQIVFIIISVITLGTAVVVVTNRNLFHAALAMMASFLGVAGLYVLLEAGFLAAAQLLVYIGAISILVIFAIMMTRRLMQTHEMPYNSQYWYGLGAAGLVFLLLMFGPYIVYSWLRLGCFSHIFRYTGRHCRYVMRPDVAVPLFL